MTDDSRVEYSDEEKPMRSAVDKFDPDPMSYINKMRYSNAPKSFRTEKLPQI